MWTPTTRKQHNRRHLRYGSDLTDTEWAIVEPFLPPPSHTGRPRRWPMREIINAIFYVLRSGCPWQMVPDCFPPPSTVYRWFMRLRDDGVFETMNHHLLMRDRERIGRQASPSAAVIPRVKPEGRLAKASKPQKPAARAAKPVPGPAEGRTRGTPERRSRAASGTPRSTLTGACSCFRLTAPRCRIAMGP